MASAQANIKRRSESNLQTLAEITCEGSKCDIENFLADTGLGGADYVIDTQTRYFLSFPMPTAEDPGAFPQLDFYDSSFIRGFTTPGSYAAPDGEIWRLYARAVNGNSRRVYVVVGNQMKASSKIDADGPPLETVDASLVRDANQIAADWASKRNTRAARNVLTVDGFAVVDSDTDRVLRWGWWLPAFFPKTKTLPTVGWRVYQYQGNLYVLRTDSKERILAASFIEIGNLWWIIGSCCSGFLIAGGVAQVLSRRHLRSFFALRATSLPTLDEALRTGEGQNIEFKGGISDAAGKIGGVEDEVLKSIAAFANSNDGVIFIGIDDGGRIRGLDLDFKAKDRIEGKIRQLVRSRIRPTPPVHLTFEDHRGLVILKIAVARGEDPAYLLNGVIYVRYGFSDVQAQPEDLKRLISEYAS